MKDAGSCREPSVSWPQTPPRPYIPPGNRSRVSFSLATRTLCSVESQLETMLLWSFSHHLWILEWNLDLSTLVPLFRTEGNDEGQGRCQVSEAATDTHYIISDSKSWWSVWGQAQPLVDTWGNCTLTFASDKRLCDSFCQMYYFLKKKTDTWRLWVDSLFRLKQSCILWL